MNLPNLLRKPTPVDLDELEAKLHEAHEASESTAYAPPGTRQPRELTYTPLQLIAHAITKLTWADAVKMGKAIESKLGTDGSKDHDLTAAIQQWAEGWKNFADIIGERE